MNIKEIIESGSLELYVMGSLPPKETGEIDALRKEYPEMNSEINRIEEALINYAKSHAVQPAAGMKEKIAKQLNFEVNLDMQAEMVDSIVIQMPGIYKFAAAAAIALIIAFGGASFYFGYQYRSAQQQLLSLRSENSRLAKSVEVLSANTEQIKGELAVAGLPENQKILLNGLPISPVSKAVVYWNKETGKTYLNASLLPAIAAEKQFQLWAIVDGKPVGLGVIAKGGGFLTMQAVQNASAFAITLEPLGGSASPTLDQMYVMGKV